MGWVHVAFGGAKVTEVEREARGSVLGSFLLLAGLGLLVAWLYLCWDNTSWTLFSVTVSGTALCLLSYGLRQEHERLAIAMLLSALAVVPLAAAALSGNGAWLFLLSVPIVVSGFICPFWATVLLAVALLGICDLSGLAEAATSPLGMSLIANSLVACAGASELRGFLQLHWRRSLQAYQLTRQAHERQGELNRTIKALDTAYRLLEESNYQLAALRREAEEWRDLKTRFATNLSHELRTPLNVILGFSQLIYRNPKLYGFTEWPEALMRDLVQVQRNAAYLSDLVNDIVDLARVDALAMPIRREWSDFKKLVEETASTVESLAQGKGIPIHLSLPPEVPNLYVDPVRIRQVLFNLLSNAIRFTDAGEVRVSVAVGDQEVVVSVADTGRGIPPEELEGIFDEFRQLGRPRTGEDSGKGLGLAIAKRFVQLHGGRIWAESKLGEGSIFYIALPLQEKAVGWLRTKGAPQMPGKRAKPKVLVLDQDESSVNYLRRHLEMYDFLRVSSWNEAEEYARGAIAIIINEGRATCTGSSAAAEQPSDSIPVVRCALPSASWLCGQARFAAVLTKPVSSEALLAAVRAVCDGSLPSCLLVVDDDRSFVQLVARTIQAEGGGMTRVVTAYNGEEALRKARWLRPNAILLDLVMPNMSGFQVFEEMQREDQLRSTPIIAVTAASPGEDDIASRGSTFWAGFRGLASQKTVLELIEVVLRNAPLVCDERAGSGSGQPGNPPVRRVCASTP